MSDTDLLIDLEQNTIPAEKNLRFFNFLIDTIFFYVLVFLFTIILAVISPNTIRGMANENSSYTIMSYVIGIFVFLVYFTLTEGFFKGKTLGKLITKTRAVKEDGSALTYSDAFKRALSRAVPFEAFSAFGDRPWHDKWTDTVVVKE